MKGTKEYELMETLEMQEIFSVEIDVNRKKFLHREGFFASVVDDVKPYAWYHPKIKDENISIGAIDYLYDDSPGEIELMSFEDVIKKINTFGEIKPLCLLDATVETECGYYYGI